MGRITPCRQVIAYPFFATLVQEAKARPLIPPPKAPSLHAARNGGPGSFGYLHSWSVRSRAWAKPLSENVSVDCVPLAESPFTTALWPVRRASIKRASSDKFLIHAPSCWV